METTNEVAKKVFPKAVFQTVEVDSTSMFKVFTGEQPPLEMYGPEGFYAIDGEFVVVVEIVDGRTLVVGRL